MKNFDLATTCKKCNSNNIRLIRQMDFGMDDWQVPTGGIIFKCLDCKEIEVLHLEYEMVY